MIFTETPLLGAYLIAPEKIQDERGFFARAWCQQEFVKQGLKANLVQCNISFNRHRGTLRGLHYQVAPHAEAKLVRCTRGVTYDVIIDLRPDSPTFLRHHAEILNAQDHTMLYVPEGFALGFETLEDNTEVFYQMSEFYTLTAGRGIRWNDPAFAIPWPEPPCQMAERDQNYPDFQPDLF